MTAETYNCPFCSERKGTPDTKGHLYFYGENKGWHCFRCGAHASRGAPPGIAEASPSLDAFTELGEPLGPDTPNHLSAAQPAWKFSRARRYLMERGISAETAEQSLILYAPVGWLRQRVIFPIHDQDQEIVYYVARDVTGFSSRKYLNAPWGKNGLVYPVGKFPTDTVVVVEGVFDAYATDRAGWHSAALLGKRINTGQSRMLATLARRALVLLDADAYASALEASYHLNFYMPTRRVELPRGKDPDSFARNDLRALLGKAMKEWADAEAPKEAKLVRSRTV